MKVPDLFVGKRLLVGCGKPEILGRGEKEVRGSAYIEGPTITGNPGQFSTPNPNELGTVMCGETKNEEMVPIPFYSLFVRTYARIKSFLKIDKMLAVELIKSKIIYTEVLMAKTKNFVIKHPTEEGMNLVYSCLEGPENGVYVRGKLNGTNVIHLPDVWRRLVDPYTITVSLTPIGAHQSLIVRGIQDNEITIASHSPIPIHCYYHVFAERMDIPRLKVEVER